MTRFDDFRPQPDLAELAAVNEQMAAAQFPDMATAEGLAAMRGADYALSRTVTQELTEHTVPGPAGELRLRVIRPRGPVRAVMLDVHGGGWSIGAPEDDDWINDYYATHAQTATVSVDYRLAPEHPHPAAVEDCTAAALWVAENAVPQFGTDRLLLHGASAGAHLAAVALLRLRDKHPEVAARFRAVSLVYGPFDISRTPSQRQATADTPVLPEHVLRGSAANAFPGLDPEQRRHPSVSPLYADLTGLPPALFTVGSLDPLLDDSLFMSARWRAAGNHAELDVWPQGVHGFNNMAPRTGQMVAQRVATWFAARLGH